MQLRKQVLVGGIESLQRVVGLFRLADQVEFGVGVVKGAWRLARVRNCLLRFAPGFAGRFYRALPKVAGLKVRSSHA